MASTDRQETPRPNVWLFSGQSNMAMPVRDCLEADALLEAAADSRTEFFVGGQWKRADPASVAGWSAVSWAFGLEWQRLGGAPPALACAARGGTGIEAWLPVEAFPHTPLGHRMARLASDPDVLRASEEDARDFMPYGEHRLARWGLGRAAPAQHFKALVAPLAERTLRGVVWYQGESNADWPDWAGEYDLWLEALIAAWRIQWGDTTLPFIIIQLPQYDPGTPQKREGWEKVRLSQARVAHRLANVACVEIRDLGDVGDIHPRRKAEVGFRAARAAWKLAGKNTAAH
jgi:sialate O-acetylesterase